MEESHVLFIEDHDLKYRAAARFLTWQGLTVVRAETYSEVCDHLLQRREQVVFILTDWSFPLGDRAEVAEACAGEAVVKMARDLGIPYAVFSGLDRPRSFEGDWIKATSPEMKDQLRELVARIKAL